VAILLFLLFFKKISNFFLIFFINFSQPKMEVKYTAADVKKLRDLTGAGMMDCKKALEDATGDFDAAIEHLRKKGQKISDKRADREAKEGVVIALVADDSTKGIVVRVSCETDFVSKNQDFINFVQSIANVALAEFPADRETLLAAHLNGLSIAERLAEKTGVIAEKIELPTYERLEAAQVAAYIHAGFRAGVLVGFNKQVANLADSGRNVAMQVAAMHAVAVDKDGVDAATIEKEIEIGKEQARNEGKPEAMLEKIALGKLNSFYKEKTLLNQEYVKDNKQTVRDYLKSIDKDLTVTAFKHVVLG
jgi:elongation factor Ts